MSYRYMVEFYQQANELLEMIAPSDRDQAFQRLELKYPDRYFPLSEKRMNAALRFLEETPTFRQRRWKKLDMGAQIRLWCDSRYLALISANALAVVDTAAPSLDGAYRTANRNVAKDVYGLRLQPTAWEIAYLEK